jgi:hypothetical protein
MSEIKSVLKSFFKTLLLLLKPFVLLGKAIYRGIKTILIPMGKALVYLLKQLWMAIKWVSIAIYKVILKPIYIVLKKIVLVLNYVIKQVSITIYKLLIKPIWWILKKIMIGIWWVIRQLSMLVWQYLIKPMDHLFRLIFKGLRFVLNYVWKGLVILGGWIKKAYMVFKHMALSIIDLVKPIFIWIYQRLVDVLKVLKYVFVKLWTLFSKFITLIYHVVQWFLIHLWKTLSWLFVHIIKAIQWSIDGLVYVYRNRPEWLYKACRFTTIQVLLLLYTILFLFPKVIFIDGVYRILVWVFKGLKYILYRFMEVLQKGLILWVNAMVHVKRFMYPFKRLLLDLVFDFKDYYYVLLLLPILLPIFIVFGIWVFIEVLFIHLWLIIKAVFHMQSGILKYGYLPSLNIFKLGQSFTRSLRLSLGYQQKWRNAHTLMMLFIWPLAFPIRLVIALVLLPWTLLVGLFYGLQYLRYHDQIEFVVDDFIRIPNEIDGTVDGVTVKRYGHQLSLYIQMAIYDSSLERYVIDPSIETFRLEVEIDGERYQSYSIKNKSSVKTALLYQMSQIQSHLVNHTAYRIPLPQIEGVHIEYQITHQGDELYQGDLLVRPFSNHTDLLVKIQQDGLTYERELHVSCTNTTELDRMLLQTVFYGYPGLSILTFLDPKLTYEIIPNPHTKGYILESSEMTFSVPFKVKGLDSVYELPIQWVPSPLASLTFEKAIKKPELDPITKRYLLPEMIQMQGMIHPVDWTIDGEPMSQWVSLDDLAITHKHAFHVRVFDQQQTHEKTFHILDPRYKTAWWMIEFDAIKEAYLEDTSIKKHIHLPVFGLKRIKCIYWESKNPKQMKSTGFVKQPGITTFKVVLYEHMFSKKTVFIDIAH